MNTFKERCEAEGFECGIFDVLISGEYITAPEKCLDEIKKIEQLLIKKKPSKWGIDFANLLIDNLKKRYKELTSKDL